MSVLLSVTTFCLQSTQFFCNRFNIYNPPSEKDTEFLCSLETFVLSLDLAEPLIITGDLNMDLLCNRGDSLREFMSLMDFTNHVNEPTRIAFYKNKSTNNIRTTKTNIDNVITNGDYVKNTRVISCPFSDHMFVVANLKFESAKTVDQFTYRRDLSDENLEIFSQLLKREDFAFLEMYKDDITNKWQAFINRLTDIVESIAPIVEKRIHPAQNSKSYPWFDDESEISNIPATSITNELFRLAFIKIVRNLKTVVRNFLLCREKTLLNFSLTKRKTTLITRKIFSTSKKAQ